MLHYIKIPNLVLYDLDWLFKLKTHWVSEESERLICETYKNKILQDLCSTVTVIKDQKELTAVLEIFSILAMVHSIQCCTNFNLLAWCSILYFSLFSIFQLSSTVFAFSGLNTAGNSLTFSVLFLLLCYFNNLFLFMALHFFILNSVYFANKFG